VGVIAIMKGFLYKQQCQNMALTLKAFENGCAEALARDGHALTSKDRSVINQIAKANENYLSELEKITV